MNPEFALALADTRLSQTLQLLDMVRHEHSQPEQMNRVIGEVSAASNIVKKLRSAAENG